MNINRIPIILLAAGASSRMNTAKALLDWKGQRLINHQLEILSKLNQDLLVVLGSKSELIIPEIEHNNALILNNKNWIEGMSSSIRTAVEYVNENIEEAQAIMLCALDQPLIDLEYYSNLIDSFFSNDQDIIASMNEFSEITIPVVFGKKYFKQLQDLKGDKGAKQIVVNNLNDTLEIKGGLNLRDIDTPEQYNFLLNS